MKISRSYSKLREEFKDTPRKYRPVAFWFWNGEMREAEIVRQIVEMKKKGLGGFFIHPMPGDFRKDDFPEGLTFEYLSDRWFEKVRFAVNKAKEIGMEVWLYDEGGWPSGLANGKILKAYPYLKAKTLVYENGKFFVREVDNRTDLLNPQTTRIFLEMVHEKYRACVGEEFGKTIPGIFTDEPCVCGCVGSEAIPWTEGIEGEFQKRKGYELGKYLHLLFAGMENRESESKSAIEVRIDFCDVWTSLFKEAYLEQIHSWCRKNRLLFVGHFGSTAGLAKGKSRDGKLMGDTGHFLKLARHFDIPGIDTVWRQIFPGKRFTDFPKFASSSAHLDNKKYALSESFSVYGYGLTYQQMKWVTDFQYVRGINMLCPMAFYYSTKGSRMITICSNFFKDPRERYFRKYADYTARLSFLLSIGKPVIKIAFYYPITSLWIKRSKEVINSFEKLSYRLLSNQRDFDYIDDEALLKSKIDNGKICIGGMEYSTLILSKTLVMDIDVLRKIKCFCTSGGKLIVTDGLPEGPYRKKERTIFTKLMNDIFGTIRNSRCLENRIRKGIAYFIPSSNSSRLLEIVEPEIIVCNSNIRCLHRQRKDFHLFFVTNEADKESRLSITFPISGEPEIWNPENGEVNLIRDYVSIKRNAGTTIQLNFSPSGSFVIGFTKMTKMPTQREKKIECDGGKIIPLDGIWKFRRKRIFKIENREICEMELSRELFQESRLLPWNKILSEDFSGSVEYLKNFSLENKGGKFILDLGNVKHIAEVWVNEQYVETRVWAPYTFDITAHVKPGNNELRVVVTNTLANLMASKKVKREIKTYRWDNCYFKTVVPFLSESCESGLLGPVKVICCGESQRYNERSR